jgi:hypothetical protein
MQWQGWAVVKKAESWDGVVSQSQRSLGSTRAEDGGAVVVDGLRGRRTMDWDAGFSAIFVQILLYLCIKVYLDLWSMLVFLKRFSSKRFEWCWKREKVSCKKVVQK